MGNFLSALQQLQQWFFKNQRVLPWRENPSVYRVWVSEVMLQQTQVVTVVPYFERFMKSFPTLKHLAQAQIEEVLQCWSGLGYYSRARRLHQAAQLLVKKIPQTREAWLKIPGVGPYTAGAILSIAFNHVEPILDGNVERVMARVRQCPGRKGEKAYQQRLWRLAKIFVSQAHCHQIPPRVLNQALMELGARVCTPQHPQCRLCPLQKICRAYQNNTVRSYPAVKPSIQWIKIQEKVHCILKTRMSPTMLLQESPEGQWRAGLWDFPKQEPHVLGFKKLKYLGQIQTRHVVTRHRIHRSTEIWTVMEGSQVFLPPGMQWIEVNQLQVAVGSAFRKTWKQVLQVYGSHFFDQRLES